MRRNGRPSQETGVKSICQRVHISDPYKSSERCVDQLGASPKCIPDIYDLELNSLGQMSRQELVMAQTYDSVIGPAIQAVNHGN